MYDYLVQESLWRDTFSSAHSPSRGFRPCPVRPVTTLTLNRQLPIDYILTKGVAVDSEGVVPAVFRSASGASAIHATSSAKPLLGLPDSVPPVRLIGLTPTGERVLLPEGQVTGAVFGPPMAALDSQPDIPSDHLPIRATITLTPWAEEKKKAQEVHDIAPR